MIETFYNVGHFVLGHPYLLAGSVVALGFLIYQELYDWLNRQWWVSVSDAVELINHQQAQVLDLRDPQEFQQGSILGARQVALDQLGTTLQQLGAQSHGQSVILILPKEDQPYQIKARLTKYSPQQLPQLKILRGGIDAWQAAELPLG